MTTPAYTELLTAAEAHASDRLAESAGIAVATLMENAGRAVAEVIAERYAPRRAVVVAGSGNNGGDGVVVARLLKDRGWDVALVRAAEFKAAALQGAALIVDAIFGVGLNRAPEGEGCRGHRGDQ